MIEFEFFDDEIFCKDCLMHELRFIIVGDTFENHRHICTCGCEETTTWGELNKEEKEKAFKYNDMLDRYYAGGRY